MFYSCLDTAIIDIEECFKGFVKRDDIDIILINQNVSDNDDFNNSKFDNIFKFYLTH